MSDAFDPYEAWLQIPRRERPVDLYRLLGVSRYEPRRQAIEAGYQQRIERLLPEQAGPQAVHAKRLKIELTEALELLRDDIKRSDYDRGLREKAAANAASQPGEVDEGDDYELAPIDGPSPLDGPAAASLPDLPVRVRAKPAAARKKPVSPVIELVKIVLGGIAGLAIGMFLLTFVFKVDPFGLFPAKKKAAEKPASPVSPPPNPPLP